MDFEQLAADCRAAAFRASLTSSPVWQTAAETVQGALQQLQTLVHVAETAQAAEDDDGLGYTYQVDRQNPTHSLQQDFAPPTPEVEDEKQAKELAERVTSAYRFLRNACAASTENQDKIRATGLLELAHDVLLRCCLWIDVESEDLKATFVLLAQVALQFCVNCVTSNSKNQAAAWALFFPEDFQKLLVECHQQRKIVAFAVALILNCVNSSSADASVVEEVQARRVDLVCARNLVITMLHRCMVKPESSSDSDAASGPHIDDQDPAFEWICTLFGVLFRDGHAKDLYNAVGAHMLSKLWSRVTPEQLILLRMFTMWAVSTPKSTESSSVGEVEKMPALPTGTFEFVKSTWTYIITPGDEDRPDEAEEERKQMWMELENEAKLMLLDILGELTVGHTKIGQEGAKELLLSLLQELQRVWELGRLNEAPKNTRVAGSTSTPQVRQPGAEPFGYRSGIIRAVGNLSFRHTAHQDLVREEGYLPLFLNHCNIDEANPMIREWSLVALRNLCEGNEANQSYINALRPQGMDSASSAALEKANVRAEIGEDGKVKLTKEEK